jgi:hypothetical protein
MSYNHAPLRHCTNAVSRTTLWIRVIYKPTTVCQMGYNYGTRVFTVVFTRACHRTLLWARWLQLTFSQYIWFKIHFNIIRLSCYYCRSRKQGSVWRDAVYLSSRALCFISDRPVSSAENVITVLHEVYEIIVKLRHSHSLLDFYDVYS